MMTCQYISHVQSFSRSNNFTVHYEYYILFKFFEMMHMDGSPGINWCHRYLHIFTNLPATSIPAFTFSLYLYIIPSTTHSMHLLVQSSFLSHPTYPQREWTIQPREVTSGTVTLMLPLRKRTIAPLVVARSRLSRCPDISHITHNVPLPQNHHISHNLLTSANEQENEATIPI